MNQRRRSNSRRRNNRPNRPPRAQNNAEPQYPIIKHQPKRYGVVFYKRAEEAKADSENLLAKAKEVDQLNIVIRADTNMDDPELTCYGKVFAGEAWTTIHEKRVEDGWYDEPR